MANRFAGKAGRGAGRKVRTLKRDEAEARNALTPEERTKAFRLGRAKAEVSEGTDVQKKGRSRKHRKADAELQEILEANASLMEEVA